MCQFCNACFNSRLTLTNLLCCVCLRCQPAGTRRGSAIRHHRTATRERRLRLRHHLVRDASRLPHRYASVVDIATYVIHEWVFRRRRDETVSDVTWPLTSLQRCARPPTARTSIGRPTGCPTGSGRTRGSVRRAAPLWLGHLHHPAPTPPTPPHPHLTQARRMQLASLMKDCFSNLYFICSNFCCFFGHIL